MSDVFNPDPAATVNIDVSAASQRVQLSSERGPISVRLVNNGTATAWVNFGDSTVVASLATSFPVGPGVTEVLMAVNTGSGPLNVAVIAAAATGKIYFTPGSGS